MSTMEKPPYIPIDHLQPIKETRYEIEVPREDFKGGHRISPVYAELAMLADKVFTDRFPFMEFHPNNFQHSHLPAIQPTHARIEMRWFPAHKEVLLLGVPERHALRSVHALTNVVKCQVLGTVDWEDDRRATLTMETKEFRLVGWIPSMQLWAFDCVAPELATQSVI